MCRRGETDEETTFDPSDAPREQRERYEYLRNVGRGFFGDRADSVNPRAIDRQERYQAIADRLELTSHQKQVGQRTLESLDLMRLGLSLDLVVFCVCALVVRGDGREYHPYRSDENNDELFVEVATDLELREEQIASCWEKLRRETSLGD